MPRIKVGLMLLLLVPLLLVACEKKAAHSKVEPATKEKLESGLYRLTLTDKAITRTDVQTSEVASAGGKLVIPYSALIYDLYGDTWAYTNPEGNVFVRQAIDVETIKGDEAILAGGLEVGTRVVSVGAAELYGEETGIGK